MIQACIIHILYLKLCNFLVPNFIHHHLLSRVLKWQTIMCIQQVLKWNWFGMVTFFRWLIFYILFFCFNNFSWNFNMFFDMNLINLFLKFKDIKCLINIYIYYQNVGLLNCRKLFLFFIMFSIFITIKMVGLCSFWSFIMKLICHIWGFQHFYQWSNILFRWGHHFSCDIPLTLFPSVVLIGVFELLLDGLEFLDKVYPSF